MNENGSLNCDLVMSKSTGATFKAVTFPRLELTAAVVSIAASTALKEERGISGID